MADTGSILALAQQHLASGRTEQARLALHRGLQRSPHDPDLNGAMCFVLHRAGQHEQAAYFGLRALEHRSDAPFAINIANLLALCGKHADASRVFERALRHLPGDAHAWSGLIASYSAQHRLSDALRAAIEARGHHPAHPRLAEHHGAVLRAMGRLDEAFKVVEEASFAHPVDLGLAHERAFNSNYPSGVSRARAFEAHRSYGALLSASAPRIAIQVCGIDDANRRLRLAFLSPDFREHSVAYYALPLIEGLDREVFEIMLYHTHATKDAVTARFRASASSWCDAEGMSDDALARRIAEDRADVLVDLAGYTGGGRPEVLARRPAPVVATYLGYPNTLGMASVSVRLVDGVTDPVAPPGMYDGLATESLVRLDPCFLCYRGLASAPEVGPLPMRTTGFVTFGSFNSGLKMSDQCVALWARVLRGTPGSRLLLKNFNLRTPEFRAHLLARFERGGIGADRLELLDYAPSNVEHLALYGRVDLALDTFPYHGTTTTCEAFHMGVPTVTLEGDVHAARVGCSLLKAVGLEDLIARSEDDFVRIAGALAGDAPRLASIRASLRDRQTRGVLGDEAGFARRFGAAVRDAWRGACGVKG